MSLRNACNVWHRRVVDSKSYVHVAVRRAAYLSRSFVKQLLSSATESLQEDSAENDYKKGSQSIMARTRRQRRSSLAPPSHCVRASDASVATEMDEMRAELLQVTHVTHVTYVTEMDETRIDRWRW